MILNKIMTLTNKLEDPKNPLLGPTIKGLYFFGLWPTGSRWRIMAFNSLHLFTAFFIFSELLDLYLVRHDTNKVLNNMSVTVLSAICFVKFNSCNIRHKLWKELSQGIATEEILQMSKQDHAIRKHIYDYTKYTRIITYLYWVLVFMTNILLILTPFLKYATSQTYRDEIEMGIEPLPQILCSWFPFDNTRMPGYIVCFIVHVAMGTQGAGVLATFDMNAIAIMSYLKGQMIILKDKCENLFTETSSAQDVLDRIKECHRHHNVLVKHHSMFNALLSPIMFIYVLLCSITICGGVVQFSSKEVTPSQKLWVIQYTTSLVSQLFLYCWHSNEVMVQSIELDKGIYSSNWWQGDVRVRKQLLLLAGKLSLPLVLDAGPYTTLSVPIFIDIIKGTYSFYTLFSQMQEEK